MGTSSSDQSTPTAGMGMRRVQSAPTGPATSQQIQATIKAVPPPKPSAGAISAAKAPAPVAKEGLPAEVAIQSGPANDGVAKLRISVRTPPGTARQPSDIVCVIDISGSMGSEAKIMGAGGTAESHGLSLLDVAKHGVRTIVNALNENDRLGVVAFNNQAFEVFPLTAMNEAGHKMAEEKLNELQQGGGTNIWEGLVAGLDALRAVPANNRFGHVMLLTDGESQNRETILPNLEAYKQQHESLPGTINTFGFGYQLDSSLLVNMANAGSGAYSFIPDAGFVGTAFVNMMSQLLVTFGKGVFIKVEKPEDAILMDPKVHGSWPVEDMKDFWNIGVGTLQYGQSKDIVMRFNLTKTSTEVFAAARYEDVNRKQVEIQGVTAQMGSAVDEAAMLGVEEQWCRSRCVEVLVNVVSEAETNKSEDQTKQGLQKVVDLAEELRSSPAIVLDTTQALNEDIQGQSSEALSRHEWYWRWGFHYLPSVVFAHKLQMCNNFKDPGVQHYGGDLFRSIRDEADDIFCKLPAPKPTARTYNRTSTSSFSAGTSYAPVNMAAYNDASCG